MTSLREMARADGMIDDASLDDQSRRYLLRALSLYDTHDDFLGFAMAAGMDPASDAARDLWEAVHVVYVRIWKRHGWEGLQRRVSDGFQMLMDNGWRIQE